MERIENWVGKGLMKVEKESEEYESIKNGFLKGMGFMGHATTIMALHKNDISFSLARQARWDSFKIFSKAMAIKRGGDANVRYAWYGGSLDELLEIVSVGFNGCKNHDESHGVGIPLFSVPFSIDRCVPQYFVRTSSIFHINFMLMRKLIKLRIFFLLHSQCYVYSGR